MRAVCTKCHASLHIRAEQAGQICRCPKCRTKLRVPSFARQEEDYPQEPRRRRYVEEDERPAPRRYVEEDERPAPRRYVEEDERPAPAHASAASATVINVHTNDYHGGYGGYRPAYTGWHIFHICMTICTSGLWLFVYIPHFMFWKANHPGC